MDTQTDNNIGWKKQWHKLVVLLAAILHGINFLMGMRELKDLPNIGRVLGETALKAYEMQLRSQCSLRLLGAVIFFGIFFIGTYVTSKSSLRRAEKIFLIVLFVIWIGIGFWFELLNYDQGRLLFGFFLVLIGVSAFYTLIKKKEE